jgi:sulfoxide reductase heme-binding subunit YedZ
MKDTRFSKTLLFINSLVPLILLGWDAYRQRLGANPTEFVTRTTGMLTLIFIMLTLAVTPARKLSGWNWLGKFRRMIGLYAFFYGFLHLLTYVWFDRSFKVASVPGDIVQRPFIAIGMASFFLLVPLAITSTNKMVKRVGGKRWNKLHKLVYLVGIGGVVHYYILVKSDTRLPLTFGFVLAILLGYRVFAANQAPRVQSRSPVPPR